MSVCQAVTLRIKRRSLSLKNGLNHKSLSQPYLPVIEYFRTAAIGLNYSINVKLRGDRAIATVPLERPVM